MRGDGECAGPRRAAAPPPKFFSPLSSAVQPDRALGYVLRVSQKYGPAPYSLFRHQVETRIDELNDDLQRTATARMADAVQKALT